MTSEVKNVPELRFSQFDKEWKKTTIADIGEFYYGRSAPKWSITDDATIPCVRYGELYTKHKGTVKEIYSYTNIDRNKLLFSKGGEILIPRVGEDPMDFAKCSYLPFSGVAIGEMISVYNTDQNPVFITAYFNSQMKYEFAKRVEGASVSNLYYSYLKDINLRIPTIEEQQKIGDFFSKLDRQIELEEQKLAKLEEQKKGYMQQIFSQKICFKDDNGNDYPEWESKKFLDIFKLAPSKNNQIKSSEVVENGIIPVVDQGKDIFLGYSNEKDKAIEDFNNVIVYGDHTTIIKYIKEPFIIGGDGVKLLESNDGSLIHYLYILLQYFNVKPEGYKRHYSILKNKMMNISNTKEEQEKIGNFFTKFDELIEKQSSKIGVLKQRKKGFLQKMFV